MISLAALLTVALAGTPASPPPEAPPDPAGVKAPAPAPPTARREPVVDTYHGVAVTDPYRWLEDGAAPEVQAWSDAQNAWARAHLDGLPSAPALRTRIAAILEAISGSHFSLRWRGGQLFAEVFQPPKQQPFVVAMPSADRPGEQRVVVDPNLLDPAGGTSIDWYFPSPDGKRLAVSLSAGGSESGDVHVFDALDAEAAKVNAEVAEVVPRVNGGTAGGSLAWVADGSGFYYTRYPAPGERPDEDLAFYQQVYFHRLGTPPAEDRYEIGRDFPKIAETKLHADPSSPRLLAEVQDGDSGRFTYHLRAADGTWRQLAGYEDEIGLAAWGPGGDLFLVSRRGAPNGRVLRLPPGATSLAAATTVVAEGPDPVVTLFWGPAPMVATADRLYVTYQLGGPSEIRAFDHAGHPRPAPRQLPVSAVGAIVRLDGETVLFSNGSFLEPIAWYRFDPGKNETVETALVETSPVDLSDAEVVREFAVSKDGTRVPVNVLRKKGIRLDGSHPALLTGYGGYAFSLPPDLNPLARIWLDVGGVYAIANLRGGGEFGEAWHDAGRLTRKQNVFDDFAAAMKLLVDAGYTRPERLAISGASNGGLLMGAMIVQHPAAFRAAASSVGIYDMLRNERTPNGSFNVPEYGSVADPEQFRALYAYSPFHHVVDGTAYPAVLLTTGANDPRVDPMHSRKFLARLQAATSSDRPILLRTSSSTGHGIGSPLAAIVEQLVDQYAFLFDQLGVTYREPPKPAPPAP